jgi:glucose-1-phosphate cytidylyltransferase
VCLGYRGNIIKESFLNYEAMNNDFTICLGRQNQMTYHEEHQKQDFKVTLAETGPRHHDWGGVKRVEK